MTVLVYSVFIVADFKLYVCVLFKYGTLGPYFVLSQMLSLFQRARTVYIPSNRRATSLYASIPPPWTAPVFLFM